MKLSFNYYHKLEDVELYLCNPDGRELFPLIATNRVLTIRFNDLSVIEFTSPAILNKNDGTIIEEANYYDYIETMRLVFVTNVGWFKIVKVTENDNGIQKSKSVTAESLQSVFKDKGFVSEEKVYKFYDPADPTDSKYNPADDGAIPSVVGQLNAQLGIRLDLSQGTKDPEVPYDEWTITYISEQLYYTDAKSVCRTFSNNVTYGYDWMVNEVEDAFEVVFIFDFMNRIICIKTVQEAVTMSNVCFSFDNFMNSIDVVEDASNITTVLSCNGNNIDITSVNPTGTNYIVDFSYYMDKKHRWMSDSLIAKLDEWQQKVASQKSAYSNLISQLRSQYATLTSHNIELTNISLILQDLKNVRDKYILSKSTNSTIDLPGIISAETIVDGEMSVDKNSRYNQLAFSSESTVIAHAEPPSFDSNTHKWTFSGDSGIANTATNCFNAGYYYFIDTDDRSSYCKLDGKANIDVEGAAASYSCSGFTRYIEYEKINTWINIRETQIESLNASIKSTNSNISAVNEQLADISSTLNLQQYLSTTPDLLKELSCYWIEGEYTNENIAVLDNTTPEEEIDLANSLLESGKIELAKVCQPRLSFTLEASNTLTQYEFRRQMNEIELGRIIVVEKEEGLWYYPALLEMTFSLDNDESFDMVFANTMRLDDWGYTYADLITNASATSRQVSANWQNLIKYSKERDEVSSLIKNPLDTTLRASFANMVNQEFTIDSTGILGRKFKSENNDDGVFENEQIRIINNVILFTDDGWDTIKTAFGKIRYEDEYGKEHSEYGLIGETIIGRLLIGERLEIINNHSTIKITGNGIYIEKPVYAEDGTISEYRTMFKAVADTGELYVHEAEITGNIKGGTININDNFQVDSDGNVILNGSITWGVGASPTKVLYANAAIAPPADNSPWSNFPETSTTGWHTKNTETDFFASFTYDGGKTWGYPIQIVGRNGTDGENGTDGIDGNDGSTIRVVYLYYRKTSLPAPGTPSYDGSAIPTGWTLVPQGVTNYYLYEFVSQCTVIDGTYGTWSTPVLWAKYGVDGSDGSDASVTDENVFNALTSNGTMYGCFTAFNNQLYINAAFIRAGTVSSNITFTGRLVADDAQISGRIVAESGTIAGWDIRSNQLYKTIDGIACGIYTGNYNGSTYYTTTKKSLVTPNYYSTVRFFAGAPDNDGIEHYNSKFSVLDDGSLYAEAAEISGKLAASSGSSIGNFRVNEDGNLSLIVAAPKSNYLTIQNTYSNVVYKTIVSTASIQITRQSTSGTNYLTIDCGGINNYPQICFGYNGVYSGISFEQHASCMYVSGSGAFVINDNIDFGVHNAKDTFSQIHSGVTCQIRIQTTTGNYVYMRIDKGIITGLSQDKYDTTQYPDKSSGST